MGVTGRDIRVVDGSYTNDPRRRARPSSTPGSASATCRTTSPCTPGCWPSSPATCRSRPHCVPTRASARTRLTAPSPWRSTASACRCTHRSRPTTGSSTTTAPPSPVPAPRTQRTGSTTLDGALVASFTVDAMVRPFPRGAKGPMDARTAVSLTTGRGSLAAKPAGRFSAPVPGERRTWMPFRRRVRAMAGERTLIDSDRALLLHRPGQPPTLAFPRATSRGSRPTTPPTPRAMSSSQVRRCRRLVRGRRGILRAPPEPVPPDRPPAFQSRSVRRSRRHRARRHDRHHGGPRDRPRCAPYVDPACTWSWTRSQLHTYCPYKGTATYWNAVVNVGGAAGRCVELRRRPSWSRRPAAPGELRRPAGASVLHDLPVAD